MKLVVNRKPTKPTKPRPKTVRNVLVVGQHRDGTTRLGWSKQKNADLLWLAEYAAHALKRDMMSE